MYWTIANRVVDERTSIEMASLLFPDANDSVMRTSDMNRNTDITVHHQCSNFARRNLNVHEFDDSVMDARVVTRPWRNAVNVAIPMDDQRKAIDDSSLGRKIAKSVFLGSFLIC